MANNQDQQKTQKANFMALCDQLDTAWRSANNSQRTESASELVGFGVNNLVLHYQLYRELKKKMTQIL